MENPRKQGYGWSVTLPVLLVLLAGLQTSTAQTCSPCTCTPPTTVNCHSRGLTSFPQIPPDIQRNVSSLDLGDNVLTVLEPNALENYTSLQYLYLYNNQLTSLPEGLLNATTQLQNLRLDNNSLTELPDGLLSATTRLQTLYLDINELTSLPDGLLKATTQLQRLGLNFNLLTELPDGLLNATTQLTYLGLGYNQLTRLPEGLLSTTTQLQLLWLSENRFTELPEGLLNTTTQLRELNLFNNRLTELPDGLLNATTQLLWLFLVNNQLTRLPDGLLNATTQLERLWLNDNRLTRLPDGLLNATTQLQSLWLYNNHLTELPDGLLNTATQLRELYLYNNQLKRLPDCLLNATTQLRDLRLYNNCLTELPDGLFNATTRLTYLYLYNNPFDCDCELSWLSAFLRSVRYTGSPPATCATPANLIGRNISSLQENQFTSPSQPEDLQVRNVFHISLGLTWHPPVCTSGTITKYTICFSALCPGSNDLVVLAQDYMSGLTYTLDGLSPGTTYNIRVTASTSGGEGTAANITSTTTFGVYPPQISGFPTTVQGIYGLSIQLQTTYGPISHYKVVVVSTGNTSIDTRTEVPDSMLLPASQNQTYYYAAGAIMVGDLHTTFSVGNGQISTLNGMTFENAHLSANQPYVFFTRLYSSEIPTLFNDSLVTPVYMFVTSSESTTPPDNTTPPSESTTPPANTTPPSDSTTPPSYPPESSIAGAIAGAVAAFGSVTIISVSIIIIVIIVTRSHQAQHKEESPHGS